MYYNNQEYRKKDIIISTDLRGTCDYVSLQAEYQRKKVTGNPKQNPYSFIKKISIRNNSSVTLRNLKVIYSIEPSYLKIAKSNISVLQQKKTTEINAFTYQIDPQLLYNILLNEESTLTVDLFDEDNNLIASNKRKFTLLRLEEALSENRIDDLLGSYVTPNDVRLNPLYNEALHILKDKYNVDNFNAYEYRDPNKVIEQLDALYVALGNFGFVLNQGTIDYNKLFDCINLPGKVFEERNGNELEISLLFASLVEKVGLKPIIIFNKNTCIFGCWLENNVVVPAKLDNSSYIDNMVNGQIKLKLIDLNGVSITRKCNFNKSLENAIIKFDSGNKFQFAIDVYGCRRDHILPIPTRESISEEIVFSFTFEDEEYEIEKIDVENRRTLENVDYKKDKVEYWTYKLLDLTLSNRLINCKFNKKDIQIINFRAEELVDFLSTKNSFDIRYYNFGSDDDIGNDKVLYFQPSLYYKYYKEALNSGDLVATSRDDNPDASLKSINKKSRSAQEENGCNPLYLAIGVIKWYETEKAAKNGSGELYAPILLLQLDANRNRVDGKYRYNYDISDITVNQTMVEFFYQKHNIDLRPLLTIIEKDKDENHIDARSMFNYIREQIQIKHGWAVLDNIATINNFSFASNAMWNDLVSNKDKMYEHPIIKSLISGEKYWEEPEGLISANNIDKELEFNDIALPLPADSSQIEAICSCAKGSSFVLDGPPGTGKSQTIANMITNCMYKGKKVLFVAQKAVALDVVKKRLDEIGLGQFCFYAPNINTNKKDTLSTIASLFDVGPLKDTDEFDKVSEAAMVKKEQLNTLVEKLHNKGDYFISPYEAIVGYLNSKKHFKTYNISDEYIRNLTDTQFNEIIKQIIELQRLDLENHGYYNNVFIPLRNIEYSLEIRNQLFAKLDLMPKKLDLLHMYVYNSFFKNKGMVETKNNVSKYIRIVEILRENCDIFDNRLKEDAYLNNKLEIEQYVNLLVEISKIYDKIISNFNKDFLNLDYAEFNAKYNEYKDASFLRKTRIKRELNKQVKPYLNDNVNLKLEDIKLYVDYLVSYNKINEQLNSFNNYVKLCFEGENFLETGKANDLQKRVSTTLEIAEIIQGMDCENSGTSNDIADAVIQLSKNPDMLYDNARTNLISCFKDINNDFNELNEKFKFDVNYYEDSLNYYEKLAGVIREVVSLNGMTGAWINLLKQLNNVEGVIPEQILDDYKKGNVAGEELLDTYLSCIYFKYLAIVLPERDIATLRSTDTDSVIKLYEELLDKHSRLSVIKAAARITENYPSNASGQAKSTEAYKLNKIASNGGRGLSLRYILNNYGEMILDLCPCFLMSPSAVSDLLNVDKFHFDVVIFDEASQIPTYEAISSILRADSVVIAGDQQQMPPSNFFKSNADDDYGDINWLTEDLESLLDDAIVLGLPRNRLTWHYRSRHESLIAFSNNQFYDNSLLTFPSPYKEDTAVSFNYVNGIYETRRSINKKEAVEIVKEIRKRLMSDEHSDQSIGVVTFNEAQQSLIEDEIEKMYTKHPKLNKYPGGECIFVKNLENVQGDERDVIFFSVCYGVNKKTKKLSHNFGPLSRDKGERRLNVAITRARDELIVYSSILPQDIHPERTKHEGAQYLQDFLNFAKIGPDSLVNREENIIDDSTISATSFIAEDLRKLGYVVDENVGVSSFKIDLVVFDPNDKNTGILGVLTDGDSYVDSPTCRDRNIVEPNALERLGWNIFRVWSIEYFDHPNEVIRDIINAINSVKTTRINRFDENNEPIIFEKSEVSAHPNAIQYMKKDNENLFVDWDSNLAYLTLMKWFKKLVEAEAPISKDLVLKRIREESGVKRLTVNYKNKINKAIKVTNPYTEYCGGQEFFWPSEEYFKSYKFYRLNNDLMERELTQISFIELGNAIADILQAQGKMTEADLYKEVCEVYGLGALREKNRKYLSKALEVNVDHRLNITKDGDYVFIRGQ